MILPDQLGQIPHIAVAAGKTGAMSLMNEDDLGGYSRTKNNVLGTYNVGSLLVRSVLLRGCERWAGARGFKGRRSRSLEASGLSLAFG